MMKTLLASVAPLLLVLGACGDDDDTTSGDTAASSTDEVPQLTFDGSDCVFEGPEEVTAGVVEVELVNDSDGSTNVFVGLLHEGKTAQDYLDYVSPEPYPGSPLTPWVSDMGAAAPAKAGETMRWDAPLTAGEYVTACTENSGIWFGSGLTVVDG